MAKFLRMLNKFFEPFKSKILFKSTYLYFLAFLFVSIFYIPIYYIIGDQEISSIEFLSKSQIVLLFIFFFLFLAFSLFSYNLVEGLIIYEYEKKNKNFNKIKKEIIKKVPILVFFSLLYGVLFIIPIIIFISLLIILSKFSQGTYLYIDKIATSKISSLFILFLLFIFLELIYLNRFFAFRKVLFKNKGIKAFTLKLNRDTFLGAISLLIIHLFYSLFFISFSFLFEDLIFNSFILSNLTIHTSTLIKIAMLFLLIVILFLILLLNSLFLAILTITSLSMSKEIYPKL